MIIHPEVVVTPDNPSVIFRMPKDKVDLNTMLPKILHAQGWGVGTYFNVQFISHDRTTLLHSCPFVVTSVTETVQTSEANPYQPITKTVYGRTFAQMGPWWNFEEPEKEQGEVLKAMEDKIEEIRAIATGPQIKWNLGKQCFQVKKGDEVLFEAKNKPAAKKYLEDNF